jgi:hypothetical protein
MPKPLIWANGGAMPAEGQTSRRLFLAAGSAAAVCATLKGAAAAIASPDADAETIALERVRLSPIRKGIPIWILLCESWRMHAMEARQWLGLTARICVIALLTPRFLASRLVVRPIILVWARRRRLFGFAERVKPGIERRISKAEPRAASSMPIEHSYVV